jgi:hypothetical protein
LDLDSKIVYSNLNRTIAEVESEHLSRFTVNGAPAVVGSNIKVFTEGGFTTVQPVPEPSTIALVGLALGAFCLVRQA